ncbi:conserved Plasmodium membrane protein, unknown function [Plasmodium relictum]|uniref:Uncharacterized protein n=1 Tax=Plasmodium relictum TaxID=85471 RepID=A0A1J1H0T3_PLARL|nr:conserved Plasmodium membrane protein, unknown function [Plasmodium relictum]CRG98458.1 conserved Plasmodium membrane protein, unknown function [Plasmodium relictum]
MTMDTIQDENINEQAIKTTKRKNQKVGTRKTVKEIEIKEEDSQYFHRNFKLISLSLGYIVNTFFYFLFIHISSKILDKFVHILSKISEYDYNDSLIIGSIKIIITLSIWYKYFSGGYDGDPFFHFFKHNFKLINKREAYVIFFSNIIGTFIYITTLKIINRKHIDFHLSNIIIEYIQKKKIYKNKSFLTAFIYPKLPNFLKTIIMNILILSCPYSSLGNKYIDRIFINNVELYSSIIMDFYLNEFICSFLSYVLLYIYLFTKDNLSYPIQINLIFTQLIFLFSNESSHIIGGPFMSLSWIINDFIQKKFKLLFLFFLIVSHYSGYKLASLILKKPHLSLLDANSYYQNIDYEILQDNLTEYGKVDISLIMNEHIKDSNVVDSYLGRFFQKILNLYLLKLSNKKNN